MALPRLRPLREADLLWFELRHGVPVAWRVLRERLGARRALRAIAAYARRSRTDPLADVPGAGWGERDERLSRRQFRAAVRFDDVAARDLGLADDERLWLVREIIAETGARFVRANAPLHVAEDWRAAPDAARRRFARELLGRFFNMEGEGLRAERDALSFDVTRCRFAELARAIGRPYLGPLFCEADSRLFDRADVPVALRRTGTIANGAAVCDFRFRYE